MAYYKTVWSSGDIITKQGLNNIENGIETLDNTKANKTEVPTKVSQLTNDSGYIKQADISNKVDRSEMNSALLLKADKTEIPKKVSELTNDKGYLAQADIDNALALKANKSDVDTALALKADKTEIPVNVSQLVNDAGYLTEVEDIDLSEYAKSADVNAALDLKADKTQLEGLATETYVNDAIMNALTGEDVDLSAYAKVTDVDAKDTALKAELQDEIDADVKVEANRAKAAETTLQNSIDAEVSRAKTKENSLQTAIENEVSRATSQEALLNTSINNEKSRAESAESALQSSINNEINRAKGVEANLQAAIDLKANKSEIPTIPTNVSAFTNDIGYLSAVPAEYITEAELDAKKFVYSDTSLKIAIVDSLPAVEEPGVIYFVKGSGR